jgi:hypothetical protein
MRENPMKSCFVLVLLFLLQNSAIAQPRLWDVYSTSDQPFVNVTTDRYESDSLYMRFMDRIIVVHQDSIQYLVQRNESKFGTGFLVGSLVGGVYVSLISRDSDGPFAPMERILSTTLGAVIGGSIGGMVGLSRGADTKYRMDTMDSNVKRKLLNRLFPKKAA